MSEPICLGQAGQCGAVATIYTYSTFAQPQGLWSDYGTPTGSRYSTIHGRAAIPHITRNPLGARCLDCAIAELEIIESAHVESGGFGYIGGDPVMSTTSNALADLKAGDRVCRCST